MSTQLKSQPSIRFPRNVPNIQGNHQKKDVFSGLDSAEINLNTQNSQNLWNFVFKINILQYIFRTNTTGQNNERKTDLWDFLEFFWGFLAPNRVYVFGIVLN